MCKLRGNAGIEIELKISKKGDDGWLRVSDIMKVCFCWASGIRRPEERRMQDVLSDGFKVFSEKQPSHHLMRVRKGKVETRKAWRTC